MRTGRLPAARLGIGTVFNKNLTAGRRVMYWVSATTTTAEHTFSIGRAAHYMSTIYFGAAQSFFQGTSTGSLIWAIQAFSSGGTASFIEQSATLDDHTVRYNALLIGSPHTTYIAD
jgi:hypothetical protein